MKRCLFLLLIFLFPVVPAKPQSQTTNLPAVFKNAQYVCVEAYDGDALNPRVVPEDRRAIYNVEQGVKDWNRYTVEYQRSRADLVFLVRRGRIASVTPRVEVGVGRRPGGGSSSPPDPTRSDASVGAGVDAEAGPPDDILTIYLISPSGSLDGPIWTQSLKGGLDAPELPLLRRIQHAVDTAYPK